MFLVQAKTQSELGPKNHYNVISSKHLQACVTIMYDGRVLLEKIVVNQLNHTCILH